MYIEERIIEMYSTIFMKLGTKSFYHYFLDEESFQIVVIYY